MLQLLKKTRARMRPNGTATALGRPARVSPGSKFSSWKAKLTNAAKSSIARRLVAMTRRLESFDLRRNRDNNKSKAAISLSLTPDILTAVALVRKIRAA